MTESQATELIVVRHGETTWNSSNRIQGHLDSDLTAAGQAQARAVAEALAAETFDALFSSDLGRAMQTAAIIGARLGLSVLPDARLRERSYGIAQGISFAEFGQRHPEAYARHRSDPDYVIPEGESLRQFHARVIESACQAARLHPGGRVILVTHGGALSALFRHVVGLEMTTKRRYWLPNAGINRFRFGDGEWGLMSWGEVGHLRDLEVRDDL